MTPLLLIGGGGHCRSCIDVIEATSKYSIRGIVQERSHEKSLILNYPTLGFDEDLKHLITENSEALIAVGQIKRPDTRVRLFNLIKGLGARLPIIQSPTAYRSPHSDVGEGTILMHGCLVNVNSSIGTNCIINSFALIEHDVKIGDHCHISTGSRINGDVSIGEGTFIGSGCVIKEGVTIGSRVVIGAGKVVIKDIPAETIVST